MSASFFPPPIAPLQPSAPAAAAPAATPAIANPSAATPSIDKAKEERKHSRERSPHRKHKHSSSSSSRPRSRSRSRSSLPAAPPPPKKSKSEREECTIFVQGLHPKVDDFDLFEFFSSVGLVVDIQLIRDPHTQKSKGMGYVEFDLPHMPFKAKMLQGQVIGGYPIAISMPVNKKGGGKGKESSAAQYMSPDSLRIYVGSLHFSITEADLLPVFSAFGELDSIEVIRDLQTGASKGYGFLVFAKKSEGETALAALDGFEIAGRHIRVGLAEPKNKAATNAATTTDKTEKKEEDSEEGEATSAALLPTPAVNSVTVVPPHLQASYPLPILSSAQSLPSPCLRLFPMFDPRTDTDPDGEADLRDDLRDEVAKINGEEESRDSSSSGSSGSSGSSSLLHIQVDWASETGQVFLRFASEAAAIRTQKAMHGRWFSNRQITAEFVKEEEYMKLFPQKDSERKNENKEEQQ